MGVNGGVEKGKKDSNAYWIFQSGRFRNSSIWDSFIILANSKWVALPTPEADTDTEARYRKLLHGSDAANSQTRDRRTPLVVWMHD
ncbi:hypothetical protein DEO72_LG2g2299 [Vigna unguiculata]|uniref:Uncharacterized protein n=1 Tax=Vigna unguiculata TaxID=3917 RepID=A0A4D6KZF0_VIGUN|nr:hypothetical protein DEO72_LG2g2299 [Vigna unguiculata]